MKGFSQRACAVMPMAGAVWACLALASSGALQARAGGLGEQAGPASTLAELLFRANEAIIAYERAFGAAVADEEYTQRVVDAGGAVKRTRTLGSHYMFVRSPESDAWAGLRDVHTVDGRRQETAPSLRELEGTVLEVAREANRRHRESARHHLGDVPRSLNVPTLALTFLHPLNQHRFAFEKTGEETLDGRAVWAVRFSETSRPTIIRGGTGDLFARGTFWLETATGRVVRSQLEFGDQNTRTRMQVTVTYAEDATAGLLVPVRMEESYEVLRSDERVEGTALYSNYRLVADAPGAPPGTRP